MRTRYGNSASTPEATRTCKTQQNSLQKRSRYGISVSAPHRRYRHRLRMPFLRMPFPRLLDLKPPPFQLRFLRYFSTDLEAISVAILQSALRFQIAMSLWLEIATITILRFGYLIVGSTKHRSQTGGVWSNFIGEFLLFFLFRVGFEYTISKLAFPSPRKIVHKISPKNLGSFGQ